MKKIELTEVELPLVIQALCESAVNTDWAMSKAPNLEAKEYWIDKAVLIEQILQKLEKAR